MKPVFSFKFKSLYQHEMTRKFVGKTGYSHLLLMSTTPIKAPKLPPRNATRIEDMSPGFTPIITTAPFDCTGHPAMNVPCAMHSGLPVGMMLIGKHYDEVTIYRAADAFENAIDWKNH